ncbi:MAG: hypothetical protein ACOYEN_10675, partial [Limnochordia bacterium]
WNIHKSRSANKAGFCHILGECYTYLIAFTGEHRKHTDNSIRAIPVVTIAVLVKGGRYLVPYIHEADARYSKTST